ncbi:hypothetical protein TNCT_211601 [Trichonephila clavata]|uniref:Uncharacterized protein n=1 Tax=Trichonephila clavata TaxID=2740835 RepID=A0A8X6KRG5_TRICU|nr:hypothetical protein TNCT_211601 [Trichonephila clavata]
MDRDFNEGKCAATFFEKVFDWKAANRGKRCALFKVADKEPENNRRKTPEEEIIRFMTLRMIGASAPPFVSRLSLSD